MFLTRFGSDQYKTLCTIDADTSVLNRTLKRTTGAVPHFRIDYDVVISFGLTELRAEICWMENVSLRYGTWNAAHVSHEYRELRRGN